MDQSKIATAEEGAFTVLSPDSDLAEVRYESSSGNNKTNNRHYLYTFSGWRVKETGAVLQPGQTLTFTELIAATGNNDTVELEATWNGCDNTTGRVQSANFYVSTTCEVADNMSNGFSKAPETNFTEALHASRVKGAEGLGYSSNGNNPEIIVVAPPTKEDTAYETDALLRQSPVNPILPTTAPYSGDGITLESFPSDEEGLSSLRSEGAKTIKLDGKTVNKEDITSDNFTARWYVMKYDNNDG